MTKHTIALSLSVLFASTQYAYADIGITGARYLAQGGSVVANGNDTFVLSVNPANLLSHGTGNFGEVAINATQISAETRQSDANTLSTYGGFYSGDMFTVGYFSHSVPSQPLFPEDEVIDQSTNLELSQSGLAVAIGNLVEENESLRYGIGAIFDMASGTESNNRSISGRGLTFSSKVTYTSFAPLQTQAFSFYLAAAASYSYEIESKGIPIQPFTLRPEIKRAGVLLDVAHLNQSISWELALSVDLIQINASNPLAYKSYTLGNAIQLGAEWQFIQPFGFDGDFALRAGTKSYQDYEDSLLSAGIGLTYGLWSVDFSVSEHYPLDPSRAFNLSIIKSFD